MLLHHRHDETIARQQFKLLTERSRRKHKLLIDGKHPDADLIHPGAPGGLLGGDIDLYMDNTNGDLTADELARIQDAVTAANAVTAPYGVAVMEVTDPTLADVT
jgi:hypothetical protein